MVGERGTVQPPARSAIVRLEPVRPGGAPRRRLGSVVVAMVAFVGLALWKPWSGSEDHPAQASPNAPLSFPPSAEPLAIAPDPGLPRGPSWEQVAFVPGPRPSLAAEAVRGTLATRPGWGVRAVVELGEPGPSGTTGATGSGSSAAGLAEVWGPTIKDGWASPATQWRPIRALGITLPRGVIAIDIRVLQEIRGRERWLDVEPVPGANPGAGVLFWPPRRADGWAAAWEPGRYRFVVLTADGIAEVGAYLHASSLDARQQDVDEPLWQGSASRGGWLGLDTELAEGVFAGSLPAESPGAPSVVRPIVVRLGGSPLPSMDLRAAWLGASAGLRVAGAPAVYAPRAVAIGAAGAAGVGVGSARLVRLLPRGPVGESVPIDVRPLLTNIDDVPRRDVVRFEEPGGFAWPPGVYAVELTVADGSAIRQVEYAVTLLPGSARQLAVPLTAARAWARFAGRWGVAAGLRDALDGPARLAVRFAAQEPEPVVSGGADFSRRCLELNLVDSAQPILGLSHPAGAAPEAVRLERVFLDGTAVLPEPSLARSIVPGLTLVAAGEGSAWPPGWYRLIVESGGRSVAMPVCVGEVSGTLLLVPPGVGLRG